MQGIFAYDMNTQKYIKNLHKKTPILTTILLVFLVIIVFALVPKGNDIGVEKQLKNSETTNNEQIFDVTETTEAEEKNEQETKENAETKTTKVSTPTVEDQDTDRTEMYTVTHVVDGDTIDVLINGKEERLRLIGIDTPETVHPNKPVECYGPEASAKMKELVLGKEIILEDDPSQGERDKYDRLLRYIHLQDGTNIIEKMIREGYAYEYTYSSEYKYQELFQEAEEASKSEKLGVWNCEEKNIDTNTTNTAEDNQTTQTQEDEAEEDLATGTCDIKGNINRDDEKIYHVKGCGSYNRTEINISNGERWFCSEEEAVSAGWRKAGNC